MTRHGDHHDDNGNSQKNVPRDVNVFWATASGKFLFSLFSIFILLTTFLGTNYNNPTYDAE